MHTHTFFKLEVISIGIRAWYTLRRDVLMNKKKASKQVWVKKEDNLCLVSHTALKILDTCLWYLDSGCSKHMTGDKTLLKEVQMGRGGRITYGDGSQSKVIGKGIIDIPSLGTSQEALYHIVWTMWIPVRTLLCVEKLRNAPAFICLDDSAARPNDSQCSIKLQDFFRKHRYGKIDAIVRTTWIPV
jgi:hypothetical protein